MICILSCLLRKLMQEQRYDLQLKSAGEGSVVVVKKTLQPLQ